MHSRKSIFKRGIVFILAIFAMAIFSQFKVGAACDVSIADGVDYLTLAGSNSRWSDSMLKVSDDCADAITKIDVWVNGKSAAGFVPQNYTEGQYTVEYRYTFQGETKSLYRYVRILNSSFDTSKNYTLGSFDVFEPGEDDKTDTQIVNAFYDSTNRHVINFIVSNKSTHVAITNLAGKELLRYEVAYRVGQTSYDLDLVDVLVNDNAYYLIGNTSQGGVLKRIDVSDLIVTESISVSSLNATSVYKGGYYISDSEIYLVGSDTSGYPIVDVYDGSISSYYKYETSKGVYNDMIVKFDYLYLVGNKESSTTSTKGLYTQIYKNNKTASHPEIFDEDAKFTKIVSSDNNYNIVIGETYALQISAGGTISAINTRPGYSDALVLEISNEGETKRNAGLYGSATNDIFTNIVSLGNNKYSLTGTASDGTNTLAYVLDMSDFTVTEEIVSRKSNFLVNGAINLPYGVSYYGEILSNRDLIIDVYYPRTVTNGDALLLVLDNRGFTNEYSSALTDETINLVVTDTPSEDFYKYCYYKIKYSNADHYSLSCAEQGENAFIPSSTITAAGIGALLEYKIDTETGATIIVYRTVMITSAPVPVDLTSGKTGILKWYTYNRPYTYVSSTSIRLDPKSTSYELIQGGSSKIINYTANYDYYFTGNSYATVDMFDMIEHYFNVGNTTGFNLSYAIATNPNKKTFEHSSQTSAAFASIEYAKMFAYYQEFSRVVRVEGTTSVSTLGASLYSGQYIEEGESYYIYYIDFVGTAGSSASVDACRVTSTSITNCSGKAGYAFSNLASINEVIKDFLAYNNYFVATRNTIYNGSLLPSEIENYKEELYTYEYLKQYEEKVRPATNNLTLNVYELDESNGKKLIYSGTRNDVYFGGSYAGTTDGGTKYSYLYNGTTYTGLNVQKDGDTILYYYSDENKSVYISKNACYEIYYSYELTEGTSKIFCIDNQAPEIIYHEENADYGENSTHNSTSARGNKADTPTYISSDFSVVDLVDTDDYAYIMVNKNVYPTTCSNNSKTCIADLDKYVKQTFRYNKNNPTKVNSITFADRSGNSITFYFIVGTAAPTLTVTELDTDNIGGEDDPEYVTISFSLLIDFYETNSIKDFMITGLSRQACSTTNASDPCYGEENADTIYATDSAAAKEFNEMVTHYIYAVSYRDRENLDGTIVLTPDTDGLYINPINNYVYRVKNGKFIEVDGYQQKYDLTGAIYSNESEIFELEDNYFVKDNVIYFYEDGSIQQKELQLEYEAQGAEKPADWEENYNKYYYMSAGSYFANTDPEWANNKFYERTVIFANVGEKIVLPYSNEFKFNVNDDRMYRYVTGSEGAYVEALPLEYEIANDNTFRIDYEDSNGRIIYTYDPSTGVIKYANPLTLTSKRVEIIFTRTTKTSEGINGGVVIPYTTPKKNEKGDILTDPLTGLEIYEIDESRSGRTFNIVDGVYTFNINQISSYFGSVPAVTGSIYVTKLDLKVGHAKELEGLLLPKNGGYEVEEVYGKPFDFTGIANDATQLAALNSDFVYPISSSVITAMNGYSSTSFMNKSVFAGFTVKTGIVFRIKAYQYKTIYGLPSAGSCTEIIIFGSDYYDKQTLPVSASCSNSVSMYLPKSQNGGESGAEGTIAYDKLKEIGVYEIMSGGGAYVFSGDNTYYEITLSEYTETDSGYSVSTENLKEAFYIDSKFEETTVDAKAVDGNLDTDILYSFAKENGEYILKYSSEDAIIGGTNNIEFDFTFYNGAADDVHENALLLAYMIIDGTPYTCNVYKAISDNSYAETCSGGYVDTVLSANNATSSRLVFSKSGDYKVTFKDASGNGVTYNFAIDKSAPDIDLISVNSNEIGFVKDAINPEFQVLAYVQDPTLTIQIKDALSSIDSYCYKYIYGANAESSSICPGLGTESKELEININMRSTSVGNILINELKNAQYDGNVILSLTASDELGNETVTEMIVNFWVDYKNPTFAESGDNKVNKTYKTNTEIDNNNARDYTITVIANDYMDKTFVCEDSGFKFEDPRYVTTSPKYTYVISCNDSHNTQAGSYPLVKEFDNTVTMEFYEVGVMYQATSDTEIKVAGTTYTIGKNGEDKLTLTDNTTTYTATSQSLIVVAGVEYSIGKNKDNRLTLTDENIKEILNDGENPVPFQFGVPTVGGNARWIYITVKDSVGNINPNGVYLPIIISDNVRPEVVTDGVKKCVYEDNVYNPECTWETIGSHDYVLFGDREMSTVYLSNNNVKVIFNEYIAKISSCTSTKYNKHNEPVVSECEFLTGQSFEYGLGKKEFIFETSDADIDTYRIIKFKVFDFAGLESSEIVIVIDRINPVIAFAEGKDGSETIEYATSNKSFDDTYEYGNDLNIVDDQGAVHTVVNHEFFRYAPLITYNNYIKVNETQFSKVNNYQPRGTDVYYLLINSTMVNDKQCVAYSDVDDSYCYVIDTQNTYYFDELLKYNTYNDIQVWTNLGTDLEVITKISGSNNIAVYKIAYQVTDFAGNVSNILYKKVFVIDSIAPDIDIQSDRNEVLYSKVASTNPDGFNGKINSAVKFVATDSPASITSTAKVLFYKCGLDAYVLDPQGCAINSDLLFNPAGDMFGQYNSYQFKKNASDGVYKAFAYDTGKYVLKSELIYSDSGTGTPVYVLTRNISTVYFAIKKTSVDVVYTVHGNKYTSSYTDGGKLSFVESDLNYIEIRNGNNSSDVTLYMFDQTTGTYIDISKTHAVGYTGHLSSVESMESGRKVITVYYKDGPGDDANVVYEIKYKKADLSNGFMVHESYYYLVGTDAELCVVGKRESNCEKNPEMTYVIAGVTARIYQDGVYPALTLMDNYGNGSDVLANDLIVDNTPYTVNQNNNKPTGVNYWFSVPSTPITRDTVGYYDQVRIPTYELLINKPNNWESEYEKYYVNNGGVYEPNTNPEFITRTYYSVSYSIEQDVNITKAKYDGNINSDFFYAIASLEEATSYMYTLYENAVKSQIASGYTFYDVYGQTTYFAPDTPVDTVMRAIAPYTVDLIIHTFTEDKKFSDQSIRQLEYKGAISSTMYQYTYLLREKVITNGAISYKYTLAGDTCSEDVNKECIKINLKIISGVDVSINVEVDKTNEHNVKCVSTGLGIGGTAQHSECKNITFTSGSTATIVYIDEDNTNPHHTNVVYYGLRIYSESADLRYVELGQYVPLEKVTRYDNDHNENPHGDYIWINSSWVQLSKIKTTNLYANSCSFGGITYTDCVFVTYLSRYESVIGGYKPSATGVHYYDYYSGTYSTSKLNLIDSVNTHSNKDIEFTFSNKGDLCDVQGYSCAFIPTYAKENVITSVALKNENQANEIDRFLNKKTYVELFNSKNGQISKLFEVSTTVKNAKFSEIYSYATLAMTINGQLKYYNINKKIVKVEGYTMINSKPSDWEDTYEDFYILVGEEYIPNASSEWAQNTYYINDAFACIIDVSVEKMYSISVTDSAGNNIVFNVSHTDKVPDITHTVQSEATNSNVVIDFETTSTVTGLSNKYVNIYRYNLSTEQYDKINVGNSDDICYTRLTSTEGTLPSRISIMFNYMDGHDCSGAYKVEIIDTYGNSNYKEFIFNPYLINNQFVTVGEGAVNNIYTHGENNIIANNFFTFNVNAELQYITIYKYPAYTALKLHEVPVSDIETVTITDFASARNVMIGSCPVSILSQGNNIYTVLIMNNSEHTCDGIYKVEVYNVFSTRLSRIEKFAGLVGGNEMVLTTERPDDWVINYDRYYYLDEEGNYIQVRSSATQWVENKFYVQTIITGFATNALTGYTIELDNTPVDTSLLDGDKQNFTLHLDEVANVDDTKFIISDVTRTKTYTNTFVKITWGGFQSYSFASLYYRTKGPSDDDFSAWTIVGDGVGYEVPFNAFHSFAPITTGEHTFEFKFVDAVGNESAEGVYTIVITVLPPEVGFFEVVTDYKGDPITDAYLQIVPGRQYGKQERIATRTILKCIDGEVKRNCNVDEYDYNLEINGERFPAFNDQYVLNDPISQDSRFLAGTTIRQAPEINIVLTVSIRGKPAISTELNVIIDRQAPTITISEDPVPGTSTYKGSVTVNLDREDSTNIANIYQCDAIIDDGKIAKCMVREPDGDLVEARPLFATINAGQFELTISNKDSGYFLVEASDDPINLGNTSVLWFALDNEAPTLNVTNGLASIAPYMYTNADSIKATIIDAISDINSEIRVVYTALHEEDKIYEENANYDSLLGLTREGKYVLTPVDGVGHVGESITFYIYRQSPSYTVSDGITLVKKDVAISWEVSDNELVAPIVSVTVDGALYNATYSDEEKKYIGDVYSTFGEHTFVITDAAGNRSVIMVTINDNNKVCINGVLVQVKMQAYYTTDNLMIGSEESITYAEDDVIIFALPTQAIGADCVSNGLLGYRTLDPENSFYLVGSTAIAARLNSNKYNFVEQGFISKEAVNEVNNIGGTVVVFVVTKDVANTQLGYNVGTNFFMEDPIGWTMIFISAILALIPSYRIFVKKKVRII